MAQRIGTLITAPVRISDDTIPYPAAYQEEIQGGAHSNALLTDRDGLPVWVRQWGMTFTVYNDGANNGRYVLKYGAASVNLADNANWVLDSGGSSGTTNVTKLDINVTNSGQLQLPANCILYMVMVNATGPIGNFAVGYTPAGDEVVFTQPVDPGYNTFSKGVWIQSATTLYFRGVNPASICSAIIFKF